jgi:vacuolar-type H+-ATPase subunit I/STV1
MSEKDGESSGVASRFLGAIKGALFEEEKTPGGTVAGGPGKAAAPAAQAQAPKLGPVVPAAIESSPMAKNMMDIVMSKTTAYTALVEAIQPLAAFIPDEGARYKAAFSIVGKTRTVDQIVQAIDLQHMQTLDAEVQRFKSQAQSQEANEVESRRNEIVALQQSIESANKESERLRQEMENRLAHLAQGVQDANQKIAQKEKEIAEKNAAISRVNADFSSSVEFVKSTLLDARAKVLLHLVG